MSGTARHLLQNPDLHCWLNPTSASLWRAKAFRAPSSTEKSANSIAAFGGSVINDNARCAALTAAGVAAATVTANCRGIAPTFVQRGNPALEPEKSDSYTLGLVFDVTSKTSLTADLWQIKRKGLPVIDTPQSAVDAGRVTRDPATSIAAGDPGSILTGAVVFQTSSSSTTNGFDVEAKSKFDLYGYGGLTTGLTWTHLITQRVTDADGTVHDYAGTHGNCDITNCIGSPRDRVSLAVTYDYGPWRVGTNVNYRGKMSNKLEQSEDGCDQTLANGADSPNGCTVKSFTTFDLSASWKYGKNLEVFGSIANLFDKRPPQDFQTYGAIGYNPLDYSGAIGRFYRLGAKYSF